ncbi:MAG: hypothetical protein ACE14W_12850 [Candidatus Velamenicoccus archaeovorus]
MVERTGGGAVLVVQADAGERESTGSWLEASGYDVLSCPGPTEPDYTCVAARGNVCPLAQEASVVVLDMSLDSEAVMVGTPAEDLLGMYLVSGHRVVVLGSHPGQEVPGQLIRLPRHPDRGSLLEAIRALGWPDREPGPDREVPGT